MKFFSAFLLVMVLFFVKTNPAMAQLTATSYILNPTVVGNQYSFEVWAQRTNVSGNLFVGISSFVFDVDQTGGFDFGTAPTLSAVNSKFTGTDGNIENYGPMSVQWSTVASVKKINVTINFTGNGGGSSQLVTTAPNGEKICTVSVTIIDGAKTASLSWDQTNSAVVTSNSSPVTNSFSGTDNSALPVELSSFSAIAKGRNVELAWSTATEVNNQGFDVERKAVGGDSWTKVGSVDGNGTSSKAHDYSFSDKVSAAGKYNYRLKQNDRDGSFKYSNVIEATATLSAEDYKLSTNYPNPFNPSTNFTFAVKEQGPVAIKIYNIVGQEVATLFNGIAQPDQIYTMRFDASNLSSGTYFYSLRTKDRFEIKKMLLMK